MAVSSPSAMLAGSRATGGAACSPSRVCKTLPRQHTSMGRRPEYIDRNSPFEGRPSTCIRPVGRVSDYLSPDPVSNSRRIGAASLSLSRTSPAQLVNVIRFETITQTVRATNDARLVLRWSILRAQFGQRECTRFAHHPPLTCSHHSYTCSIGVFFLLVVW